MSTDTPPMTDTTNEPDDWLDKIIDGLYYQFTGDVESQEEVDMQLTREEAHAAITAHLLAAVEAELQVLEEITDTKGILENKLIHAYALERLAVLVTSKKKGEA